ncbi:CLUMA_CG019021, isoform A [Clunio marinus]|uniref:CLUMA_CG019021, isoform A n=1 Tax=Clunio marinus TaxID=568069 RepID=A0A1J1J3X2_9DIPT|nr:CLUMA_CG019021, isoform A [Clunio marinus]
MEIDEDRNNKMRAIASELNILTRSDGSAIITQGGSCCIASVNGPLEVSPANIDMNKAYVEVIYRPKCGLPGVNERYKEKIVKSLCETCIITQLYPRTQITVQAQEMDDHGGLLACAINAVNLAIMNSGLEMKFHMAAIHCGLDSDDNLNIDPEYVPKANLTFSRIQRSSRSQNFKGNFTFVFDSTKKSLIGVNTDGKFTIQQYNEAQKLCKDASRKIFDFYREMVKKYATVL